jgi:predicted PurR-regulated permease PerM
MLALDKWNRITQLLLITALVMGLMIMLKAFLIPISYGLLIALIIYPICKYLEGKKFSRALAITLAMCCVVAVFAIVVLVLVLQVKILTKEIPQMLIWINQIYLDLQIWLEHVFGISLQKQASIISNSEQNISGHLGALLSGSFNLAAGALFNLIIIPIYTVLFLSYRSTLVAFAVSMVGDKYKLRLNNIISDTIHVYFNYIKGMLLVYLIVGVLNGIGLSLLGVNYAWLLGMVSAFMTIIPYAGIIISSILPITMIWSETNNVMYPLGVIGIYTLVQYLEANIIFPYIVGRQLGVNMLISILAILFGGVVWGVSGMILFLPFVALLKIISGHIPEMKALNILLASEK